MLSSNELIIFSGAALLLVLSPGPNMVYLISRSICQGRKAGIISLLGVISGFVVHMLAAAIGLSAIFITVPFAYEALKWLGAIYLLWLAWQALKPGAKSPFEPQDLPEDSNTKLFVTGLLTNLLNPKAVMFYLALFPQFISPENGSVFIQSLILGSIQIVISFVINLLITLSSAGIARWFSHNPVWLNIQRYVMGSVLAALAFRLVSEEKRVL